MVAYRTYTRIGTRATALVLILVGLSGDKLSAVPAPGSDYYFYLVNVTKPGRYTVEHRRAVGSLNYMYNSFFVEPGNSLATREKWQVLLSGPFGTVYAHSTYFYDPPSPTFLRPCFI
jgi:hypothetical protein